MITTKALSLTCIILSFTLVCLWAEEPADRRYRLERADGVEMAALQAATGSTFYLATVDAVPELRSLTVAHGVTPRPIRTGSATISSNPPARNRQITVAVSSSMTVSPVWVAQLGPQPFYTGGDGTEEIDFESLKVEDLGSCGRVPGTGKTKLGIGLYKHGKGRGYSGNAGSTLEIAHKDVDFYEMAGPFECSRLPFKIHFPVDREAPADARIEAMVAWFPRSFRVAEQKEDLNYADLPEGSLVIAAAMNLRPAKEAEPSGDDAATQDEAKPGEAGGK